MAASDERQQATYGNWRRPRTAGLLGLGSMATGVLIGALVFIVLVATFAGPLEAVVLAAVLGLLLLAVITKDVHGKNLINKGVTRMAWWSARSKGRNIYRSGPTGATPLGTYQPPGIAAPIRLTEHVDSYDRPFALLYTPYTSTYTVVFGTEPDGSALVDQEQIDLWVADWGNWLANLGDEPGVEAASVTIETAPDTGSRLRQQVGVNIDPNAPAFARAVLDEVIHEYPVGSSTVRAYVAVTFSSKTRKGGKKRQADEMGRELASRLPALSGELQATGAGAARPLSAQELCEVVRIAYDPAAAALIDEARASGEVPDLSWHDVGPTAADASWDGYRHDSAFSRTWSMTGAPRGLVQSGVLFRLLRPHPDIARKRVTMLYRPNSPAKAAAIVEADLNAAAAIASSGRRPTARSTVEARAAAATASEEASGAGLVNFGMLVTATVLDPHDRDDAYAAVDNLSASARLRLRPVYASQDSAFAAALPLGLVVSKHLLVSSEFKEKM